MPITATRTTVFRPAGGDQDSDGFVDIGDILRHTLVINNTGTDATNVVVNDPLNGSTLTGTVNVSPLAFNDSFTAVGNTLLEVGNATMQLGPQSNVAGSVLSNDVEFLGDAFTISAFDATSANGGTVTMVTSGVDAGSFTYISAAGFTGTDTFTYTIRDDGLDGVAGNADDLVSIGTVTITVTGQVWYVQAGAVGGNGTSTNPFGTVTAAGGQSGANDYVYVQGAAGGSITLDSGEQLIGTGTALVVGGFNLAAAGANSSVNLAGAGFTVTLGSNNTISGVDILNTGGGALTGTGFGTLNVSDVALDSSGQALSLATGAISGTGFNSTDSDGGTNNVNLQSVTGNLNLGGGALSGATSNAVVINGGNGSVDYNGTVTHTSNGHAIQVINKTGGTVDFDGSVTSNTGSDGIFLSTNTGATINFDGGLVINTSSSNTTGFQATTGGTVNVTGGGNSITSGTGTSLDLNGVTVGTGGINFATVNNSGASNGVLINTVNAAGAAGINLAGGAIAGATTRGVDINATSANVTVGATISTTAAGRSVEVTNSGSTAAGGSTISFTGGIDDNGLGINLDNNDQNTNGATINFSGGLDIDAAGANIGFNAVNGGTVNVTGATNSIVTTTGIALNVTGTNIGASDLNFRDISSNGATSGIVLSNTGNVGGLTVTGDAGSAVNASGGTINNSTGVGISLTNTRDVNLDQMTVQNGGDDGINGSGVTNFALTNSTINNNGNALQEHGVQLDNVSGAVTFTGVAFTNNETSQLTIINTSGTANVAIDTSSFTSTGLASAPNGLHGVHMETQGTAAADLIITNSAFNNLFSNSVHATNSSTGTFEMTVASSTFNNVGASAINLAQSASGTTRFYIHDNPTFLRGTNTGASATININQSSAVPAGAVLEGAISNNVIGNNSSDQSASTGGDGIRVLSVGSGTTTVRIDGNNIQGVGGNGINVQMSEDPNAAHTMNATIFNNTVSATHINSFDGIRVVAGSVAGDVGLLRLDLHDNTAHSATANDFTVRQRFGTSVQLLNYAGGATDTAAVQTYLDVTRNNNPSAPAVWFITTQAPGTGFTNTASVPQPTLPTPMLAGPAPVSSGPADKGNGTGGALPPPTPDNGDLAPSGGPAPSPVVVDDGVLSQAELSLIVEAAIQRWAAAGATAEQIAAMRAVAFSVADLPGLYLGVSDDGSVTLDSNAAGFNWFVDATPGDDSEYNGSGTRLTATSGTEAGNRMDLLTTIMHELGHQIGLADDYAPGERDELMYGTMSPGERRLPGGDDAAAGGAAPVVGSPLALTPINLGSIPAGSSVTVQWDSVVDSFGAGLVPTYNNASTITGNNPGAFSVNSNTETLSPSSAPLALDSLVLGGTVWNDNGVGAGGVAGNGVRDGTEAGINGVSVTLFVDNGTVAGVWDASDTQVGSSQLTAGGGNYSFTGLAAGDYIVRIDADNFDAGGNTSLVATPNSALTTPEPIDPDNNVDNDDNGARAPGQAAYSNAITLAHNTETTADGSGQLDINNTLDFAFLANLAPVIHNLGGDVATYTEGGAAVLLDDSSAPEIVVTVTDDQSHLNGGSVTISITAGEVAAEDVLGISTAAGVTLSNGTNVGSTVSVGGLAIGTVTATGTGGADLVIALNTTDATPARVTTLVQSLTYANTNTLDPNTGARTVSVTVNDGATGTDTETVTVNVVGVNDEPTLIATGVNPTFLEGGAAVDIYSAPIMASTIEAGQTFTSMTLTVTNVFNPGSEVIVFDGSDVAINHGNAVVTTGNMLSVSVTMVGNTATLTFSGASLSAGALQTIIDNFTYRNVATNPTDGDRTVTITQLVDSGSNVAPNDNTATLAIASVVNVDTLNAPAVITGDTTGAVTEAGGVNNGTAGIPTDSGNLDSTDADGNDDVFIVVAAGTASTGGYGTYEVDVDGNWVYTLDDTDPTVQALNGAATLIDTFTVLAEDGTPQVVTITISAQNDNATITGDTTGDVTEAGGIGNATPGNVDDTGDLASGDLDNTNDAWAPVAAGAATTNGYGTYELSATGVWTYTLDDSNAAVQALNGAATLSDTFTAVTEDGTNVVVTITINAQNDNATVTGDITGDVTEAGGVSNGTPGVATDTGNLDADDVDSPDDDWQTVMVPTASSGGYGTYVVAANGSWQYFLDNSNAAVEALNGAATLIDTFTAVTTDGTTQVVTITIHAQNDNATITGDSTGDVTEAGGVANGTPGNVDDTGDLASGDLDNTNDAWAVVAAGTASLGGYGTYEIGADGVWVYTLDDSDPAVEALNGAATLTDTFNAVTEDGTSVVVTITINAQNDTASITGDSTGSVVEASGFNNNVPGTPTDTGDLDSTDIDNPNDAWQVVAAGTASISGYGTYAVTAAGVWTYTLDNDDPAVQALVGAATLTDTFNVTTQDGTAQLVTITLNSGDDESTAENDLVTTDEQNATSGNVLLDNGSGPDGDPDGGPAPTVTAVNGSGAAVGMEITLPSGAKLTLNSDGTFDYNPNGQFNPTPDAASGASNQPAIDSFTYTLNSGSTATVTVEINGIDTDDLVLGTAGVDTLDGGGGNDTVIGGISGDSIAGGSGTDTVSYADQWGSVYIDLLNGLGYGNAAQGDTYAGIENVIGTLFTDTLVGDLGVNRLDGADGDDTLVGGGGADHLVGGTGTDTASYADHYGSVFVNLGTGQGFGNAAQGDTYDSIENLTGSLFIDVLIGDAGVNVLDGGEGDDILVGGIGADTLIGGGGNDTVSYEDQWGAVYADLSLLSGFGNAADGDTYDGIENLIGTLYGDTLVGDANANVLDGAVGADFLVGGAGADRLIGGNGVDTHIFGEGDSGTGVDADRIEDFVSGVDKIDLSDIDASSLVGGNQAFSFIGAGAFTNTAGQLRYIYNGVDTTVLQGDTNGDGTADFEIYLTGNLTPLASDFVL